MGSRSFPPSRRAGHGRRLTSPAGRTASLVAAALLAVSACTSTDAPEAPSAELLDSAGIEIVTVHRPVWEDGEGWSVGGEPVLEIGRGSGDPNAEFSRIRGVGRLSDGRIVVADAGTSDLRWFGADGTYLATAGRRGEGPGEFEFLFGFHLLGDTVAAHDFMPARLTFFGPDAAYLGDVTLDKEMGRPLSVYAFGGGFLGAIQGMSNRFSEEFTFDRRPMIYRTFGRDGSSLQTVDELPGQEYITRTVTEGTTVMMATAAPLVGHGVDQAVVDGRLVAGTTDRFELRVYTAEGGLQRLIRFPGRDVPVSSQEWDAVLEAELDDAETPQERSAVMELAEQRPPPEVRPAYDRFVPDSEGYVWIRPYRPQEGVPVPWLVVHPGGDVLGEVPLPEGFTPMDIGRDYVLGVTRDELDVPFLQMYPLTR